MQTGEGGVGRGSEAAGVQGEGQAVAREAMLTLEDEPPARILFRDTKAGEWLCVPDADQSAEQA